jgi:hypothetical protein
MGNATVHPELPFEVFEEEMINPLKGVDLTANEEFVAGLLLDATSEKPIRMAEIAMTALHQKTVTLSDRQIREIVRSLRRDHGFPICSRKSANKETGHPPGYYWGRSEKELEEFSTVWMSQYKDEAVTLHRMLKVNYPRLAGQLRLDLAVEE